MNPLLAVFFLLILVPVSIRAVPPAPGIDFPGGKNPCRVNQPEMRRRAGALRAARAKGAPMAPPSIPAPRVLVIRVDFSNLSMTRTLAQTETFFQSMRSFYIENSYGVFAPTFTVTTRISGGSAGAQGAYRLGNSSLYGANCGSDVACNDPTLFAVAAAAADTDYDMTQFDHAMIYHAGNGEETTGSNNDIWSVYYPDAQTVGVKSFPGFTIVPESEQTPYDPLGVICHEYGHQIGLPDLYDTTVPGGRSTVGAWDLMDYPYTGFGASPSHLGAWSKKFLGFGSVQTVNGPVTLGPAETSSNGFNMIPAPVSNEYFLMEYRWRDNPSASYDKGLPMSGGIAIWHVDDNIALSPTILNDNSVNAPSLHGHFGVDVVEADGFAANPPADTGAGDAYVNGDNFTTPQSNTFGGLSFGLAVTSIAGVGGGSASALVSFIESASRSSLSMVASYPNPAGEVGKYPVRTGAAPGTVTTLVMRLTRPLSDDKLELDIYNADGDRIRSVSGENVSLKVGAGEPSSDYKWVYEYDWNGRNDAGGDVGAGVYFYRFRAGDDEKAGKLLIVR